jgi:hypothetical protein
LVAWTPSGLAGRHFGRTPLAPGFVQRAVAVWAPGAGPDAECFASRLSSPGRVSLRGAAAGVAAVILFPTCAFAADDAPDSPRPWKSSASVRRRDGVAPSPQQCAPPAGPFSLKSLHACSALCEISVQSQKPGAWLGVRFAADLLPQLLRGEADAAGTNLPRVDRTTRKR